MKIIYTERDNKNGGDTWEVGGYYYSHPIGAAIKLERLTTEKPTVAGVLSHLEGVYLGDFTVNDSKVRKVAKYQDLEL